MDSLEISPPAPPLEVARARMPRVLPTLFPGPPSWPTVFGRSAPLELELGFGRPHFLLERAAEAPERDIVGIEWKERWATAATQRRHRAGLANVRGLHGNAWLLAGALFAPSSLSAIYLHFPDPWWKSRHKKRRIISDAFARLLASRLVPGGILFAQSDVASLMEELLERFESVPSLTNQAGRGRFTEDKPCAASSHREKKCRADGVPIFRLLLERSSS